MTVIAHTYLLAKEAILGIARDKAFYQYAESKGSENKFILTDKKTNMPVLPENASEKTKKAYAKLDSIRLAQDKTKEQFKKLYKVEYIMLMYATIGYYEKPNGYERWPELKPFATEIALLTSPITIPYAIGGIIYFSAKEFYNYVKKAIEQYKQRTK